MRCKNCIHLDVCYEHDIIGADDNGMCTSYEPDRPHGEWIFVHPLQEDDCGAYMCSVCKTGDFNLRGDENFCPNCDADMRKGGN